MALGGFGTRTGRDVPTREWRIRVEGGGTRAVSEVRFLLFCKRSSVGGSVLPLVATGAAPRAAVPDAIFRSCRRRGLHDDSRDKREAIGR